MKQKTGFRIGIHRSLFTVLLLLVGTAYGQQRATGGFVTNYTQGGIVYFAHIFTNTGATSITFQSTCTAEYLIVGGGGGGGNGEGGVSYASGGGGGQVLAGSYTVVSTGPYTITNGAGGAFGGGYGAGAVGDGTDGENSSVFGSMANGGKGAGHDASGGLTASGTGGYSGSGMAGGSKVSLNGGGGGGNSGAGATPHTGGSGTFNNFTGVLLAYGGGGGGGNNAGGGTDGGGDVNQSGRVNSGGGGGGNDGSVSTHKGGSGIVVVRYANQQPFIENRPVQKDTTTSVFFNGMLSNTGFSTTAVCVLWGQTDGGVDMSAWAHTNWFNNGNPNSAWTNNTPFSTNITGLVKEQNYYYTFAATNLAGTRVASPSVPFSIFEATVQATDNSAKYPGDPGQFTIYRPASVTNVALTVSYAMSGTAFNGYHYSNLTGSVTLPAGSTNAVVPVIPQRAVPGPADVSATLTLTSTDVLLGSPSSATVLIHPPAGYEKFLAGGGDLISMITNYPGTSSQTVYGVHQYTSVGAAVFVPIQDLKKVEYLVIGGGGASGSTIGGGGGGGGYRCSVPGESSGSNSPAELRYSVSAGISYPVVVGAGGASAQMNGGDSWFTNIVSTGGGGGRERNAIGTPNGGSGGGGGYGNSSGSVGGSGMASQGFKGGDCGYYANGSTANGGGGGGAGSAGVNGKALSAGQADPSGSGGTGLWSSITGVAVGRAGGGGGGGVTWGAATNFGGGVSGIPAKANTGGGGGHGGTGGSGVVIVRYDMTPPKGTVIMMR